MKMVFCLMPTADRYDQTLLIAIKFVVTAGYGRPLAGYRGRKSSMLQKKLVAVCRVPLSRGDQAFHGSDSGLECRVELMSRTARRFEK